MRIYIKAVKYNLIVVFILMFILTIFNYFNIINSNLLKILSIIVYYIGIIIGSFIIGKNSKKKAYLEGIKYSLIFLTITIILNIITKSFSMYSIIFYLGTILLTVLSSSLGINIKKK